MDWKSFIEMHRGLLRQGPGTAEDVAWAVDLADLPAPAVICDAACGTGADIAALLEAAPGAQIRGFDKYFAAEAGALFDHDPRVTVTEGDLAAPPGPCDMIWCAGALYIAGLEAGLATMRGALTSGGVLAFSEPCFFVDTPSTEAVAFWEGYGTRDQGGILAAVCDAGFEVLGHRPVTDAGWEAYYQPMLARIAALRPTASGTLAETLEYCAAEGPRWRRVRAETGYLLVVARAP